MHSTGRKPSRRDRSITVGAGLMKRTANEQKRPLNAALAFNRRVSIFADQVRSVKLGFSHRHPELMLRHRDTGLSASVVG